MNGILLVNKPQGPTSFDVVNNLKKHFRLSKVGHGGTLDPFASGLLVILIGKATKIARYFLEDKKSYDGVLVLGKETDSYDVEGKIVKANAPKNITEDRIKTLFKKLEGDMEQTPPAFSAIKVGGKRAYQLARSGKKVLLKKRNVKIYKLIFNCFENDESDKVDFSTRVSKGTYIRSLAHDIGRALDTYAFLEKLKRTSSGNFDLSDAFEIKELLSFETDRLKNVMIPIEKSVDFPKLFVRDRISQARIKNGRSLNQEDLEIISPQFREFKGGQMVSVLDDNGKLLALHQVAGEGTKPEVVF